MDLLLLLLFSKERVDTQVCIHSASTYTFGCLLDRTKAVNCTTTMMPQDSVTQLHAQELFKFKWPFAHETTCLLLTLGE